MKTMAKAIQTYTAELRQERITQRNLRKRPGYSAFARDATEPSNLTSVYSGMDNSFIRTARMQGNTSRSGAWRVSTRLPLKPYLPMLKDVYPRDEYTKMSPKNGPKYYTGHFLTYDYKDTPQLTSTEAQADRPVVFKPQTIERVQTRKKYGENLKGYSSVPLHLCNDPTSFLYQRSLQPGYQEMQRPESTSETELSDMRSAGSRYPYALHFGIKDNSRHVSPVSNYTLTKNWIDTKFPTTSRRLSRTSPQSSTGMSAKERAERLARIRNAPEWYSEFFPRQKVADALKFMGTVKPMNQTGSGKELEINFHG